MPQDHRDKDAGLPEEDPAPHAAFPEATRASRPAVNLPGVIILLIAAFVGIHLLRTVFLDRETALRLLVTLAFLPDYWSLPPDVSPADLPGGWAAWLARPVTHMFLHSGWGHLIINSVWLAAFGSPVARRLGPVRFLLLAAAAAAGGAFLFMLLHRGEGAVLIGASGAISGLMGAAVRLIYATGDTLMEGIRADLRYVRPLSLAECLTRPGPRTFIIVWLGINLVFGLWNIGAPGEAGSIAWEAHTGGFLVGLVAFPLFDRRRPA